MKQSTEIAETAATPLFLPQESNQSIINTTGPHHPRIQLLKKYCEIEIELNICRQWFKLPIRHRRPFYFKIKDHFISVVDSRRVYKLIRCGDSGEAVKK